MKNILTVCFVLVFLTNNYTQGDLRLANAFINITNNTNVNVLGNVQHDNGALSQNNGVIVLTENWINNSGSTALNSGSLGTVVLAGANQAITGSDVTHFYDLAFQISGSNKTTLVNTLVVNTLNIGDAILQTDGYLTHLTNPALNSLIWNSGYIENAKLEGYFLRSTNLAVPYAFPLGNYGLTDIYRAVELTPTTNDSSVFGVRLGAKDPTYELGISRAGSIAPFDVTSKESRLGDINTDFYHNINRFYGIAEANAAVYFFGDDEQGGIFSTMAQWNSSQNQWVDDYFLVLNAPIIKPEYNNANKVARSNNILDYTDDVYALNKLKITLTTTFTPNNDGINDYFEIQGLEFYPNNKLEVYNRWGEMVYSASPYLNDWEGLNNSNGVKLQTKQVQEDTYFYVLTLDQNQPPLKNYLEIIRD